MKRVTGIGGVFFKCNDPKSQLEWYNKHLGFNTDDYGTSFQWRSNDAPEKQCITQWSPFAADTTYFAPSTKDFMFNYRVENLEWLLEELKKEGVAIVRELQSFEYGKFAHIMDPEGNTIELWEAVDQVFGVEVKTEMTS